MATGGDYQIDITGGNNDFDFDFGSNDTANDADFDLILDGDFNTMNVATADVSDIVLNWDLQMSNKVISTILLQVMTDTVQQSLVTATT